jgi:hypothetical protein
VTTTASWKDFGRLVKAMPSSCFARFDCMVVKWPFEPQQWLRVVYGVRSPLVSTSLIRSGEEQPSRSRTLDGISGFASVLQFV